MNKFIALWKQRAKQLKVEAYALYLAYRDPRVPWMARAFTACVVAYAFSPIDLIPDFIPILGYLDDLVLIPLGVRIALSMIPANVMAESRAKANEIMGGDKPVNRTAAVIIILIWLLIVALVIAVIQQKLPLPLGQWEKRITVYCSLPFPRQLAMCRAQRPNLNALRNWPAQSNAAHAVRMISERERIDRHASLIVSSVAEAVNFSNKPGSAPAFGGKSAP